jgi:hypothetical protein
MNRGIIYSEDWQMVIGADRNIDYAPIKAETKEIGTFAFSLCKQLKRIIIPEGITTIGNYAFEHCESLTYINIPQSVTIIGDEVFNGCKNLQKITVSSDNPNYTSVNGVLLSKDLTKLIKVPQELPVTSYRIPNSVKIIDKSAFSGCKRLVELFIPYSVKKIESFAFKGCELLKEITIPSNVEILTDGVFSGCESLSSVVLEEGIKEIGEMILSECSSLRTIQIPSSIKSISSSAFNFCYSLEAINVEISNKIYTSIDGVLYDKNLFKIIRMPEGKDLADFIIPQSVTTIGDNAFFDCGKLRNISIPSRVNTIEQGAFFNCKELQKVVLSSNIKVIGNDAFSFCKSLTDITIPEGVKVVSEGLFYECINMKTVNLPCSITTIQNDAFKGCLALEEISLPLKLERVEDSSFSNCSSLRSITIPPSVSYIKETAFDECENLEEINVHQQNQQYASLDGILYDAELTKLIKMPQSCKMQIFMVPNTVKEICENACSRCSSLISVGLPDSIEIVFNNAFYGCSSLKGIVIPRNIGYIGNNAFSGCNISSIHCKLRNLYGVNIQNSAFADVDFNKCRLYIPYGMLPQYKKHYVFGNFKEYKVEDTGKSYKSDAYDNPDISEMVRTYGQMWPCPHCGSRDVQTYIDGTAKCHNCGGWYYYA